MTASLDPLIYKNSFLQENQQFSEIVLDESKPIGKLHEFDLLNDEIWLLQCPKGMDITELQNHKLKIPGRTNIGNSEAVSVEFNEGKKQHAVAHFNRKGRYDLRLLPVRGTIIVRDRLKAASTVTAEHAEKYCPTGDKVPTITCSSVRHPLLGAQFRNKLELDKSVAERLQKADRTSAEILKECFKKKNKVKLGIDCCNTSGKQENMVSPIENADDDSVEFVSEEKLRKNSRHNYSKRMVEAHDSDIPNNKKKKSKNNEESVSKELQWIQNI